MGSAVKPLIQILSGMASCLLLLGLVVLLLSRGFPPEEARFLDRAAPTTVFFACFGNLGLALRRSAIVVTLRSCGRRLLGMYSVVIAVLLLNVLMLYMAADAYSLSHKNLMFVCFLALPAVLGGLNALFRLAEARGSGGVADVMGSEVTSRSSQAKPMKAGGSRT